MKNFFAKSLSCERKACACPSARTAEEFLCATDLVGAANNNGARNERTAGKRSRPSAAISLVIAQEDGKRLPEGFPGMEAATRNEALRTIKTNGVVL
jgi:hypothetical protein